MKRINKYMMTAAMAILAAGCAKEIDTVNPVGEGVVFEASLSETEPDAKAVLKPGAVASKVEWTAGDKVGIYAGADYYEYKADQNGASSTLSPLGQSSTASAYYAVYPYDAEATLANGVITTTLPSVQTPVLGSFSYHLAVAHSESLTLNFKNVCGLFAAEVTEPDVTKIEIKGNGNEDIAGKIAITVAESLSYSVVEGVKTVSISAPEGKVLQLGTYYMAILPQEFEGGVTVTSYYKDGTSYAKNVTDKVALAASGMVGGKVASGEWKVETVLGKTSGTKGNVEGTGASAELQNPQDIIIASDGSFWITNRSAATGVFKMTTDNSVYSYAKVGLASDSEFAANAAFWGADVASDGVLYIAAKAIAKIIKCQADGAMTEYKVNGETLTNIMKVLVDASGNVYALVRGSGDGKGFVIKTKNGEVLQKWSLTNKLYEMMCFNYEKTKIFVFSNSSGDVQMINLEDGTMKVVAGTGTMHSSAANYTDGIPGNPLTATLKLVEGAVCASDGTIYFTCSSSRTVRMFVPDANGDYSKGTIRTIAGIPYGTNTNTDGGQGIAKFVYPDGIALAADGKTLYMIDGTGNGTVRKLSYVKYE